MKLTSMKRDSEGDCWGPDTNRFGYGLQLNLDDDQCEALGIAKTMAVGTKVTVQAMAIVVRSGECLEPDGKGVTVSLQITDMGLQAQGKMSNAAQMIYGDD
ncbi:MAG: capsid staple protein [Erythrobacter sp.]